MNTNGDTNGDWWASLRHGGLLIGPSRLVQYFPTAASPLPFYTADNLRRALARPDAGDAKAENALLDVVLEKVIGLGPSSGGKWKAGADIGTQWSVRALTGDIVRPRRLWEGKNGAVLPVFVDRENRLGIGRGKRVVSRVVEWMRNSDTRLALVTNTRQWRVVSAGLDYEAWAEADTALWFEEGQPGLQVDALRTLLSSAALTPAKAGEPSPLLAAIQDSRRGQAELSAALGERVRQAVELLIQSHGSALAGLGGGVTNRDIYLAATRIVMRMVVALFAEARDLLPRENPIYYGSYGLQGLRESLDRVGSPERLRQRYCAWPRVVSLFRLIYFGSHHQALPVLRYGGGLFQPGEAGGTDPVARALAVMEDPAAAPRDSVVHEMLGLLCQSKVRVRQGTGSVWVPTPVDFSDLSSEYIGILYEGLLDYELQRSEEPILFLALGNEPALPLSRLETMDDKQLPALLEKFKQKEKPTGGEEEAEVEDAEEEEAETTDEAGDEAPPEEDIVAEESDDDAHRQAWDRALAWASKAAVAGKLVPKPKRGQTGKGQMAFGGDDALTRAARSLIRRIVLPGDYFLIRWGGTRKGSGTFYTRPALAIPTVQRTLRPLAYDPPLGADGLPDENAPHAQWTPKRPEQILALKVCDPAMGSGSFQSAGLRFLSDALFASLHHHKRITAEADRTRVLLSGEESEERLSDDFIPCRPDADQFEPMLRARLKRHVVEHCLYGVDLDPLAVELARLALWVETMDRELPFEFLDHKLKVGNALVGCWFDRFRDYPAMSVKREGGAEAQTKAIKAFADNHLKPDLLNWVSGQKSLFETVQGQQPEALHAEVRGVLEKMHALGSSIADNEERADLYAQHIAPEGGAWAHLREMFDAWCAVWFWPADRLDDAPLPSGFGKLSDEARAQVAALRWEYSFFHWELEFPDVFARPGAGFDAIVGNPPWETLQPEPKEFFSNHDPLYRTYGNQEALERQGELFEKDPSVERDWLDYNAQFKAMSNWIAFSGEPFGDYKNSEGKELESGERFALVKTWRDKQNYSLHNAWRTRREGRNGYADRHHPFRYHAGKLFTYKLFLEVSHALLQDGGCMGLIVPAAVYTDEKASKMRKLFLNNCRWRWIFGFENRNKIFDIDGRFKFCPIIVQKGGETQAIQTAFMRRNVQDWEDAEQYAFPYARADVGKFSPKTWSILEIKEARDLAATRKIYKDAVLLGGGSWSLRFAQGDFNMASDAKFFPPRPKWEAQGFRPDEYGRWIKGNETRDYGVPPPGGIRLADGTGYIHEDDIEKVALPIYEGRMVGQFDFSQKGWVSGKGRGAVWHNIPFDQKAVEPQFLTAQETAETVMEDGWGLPELTFMDVCSATNARTMYASFMSRMPCGHSAPVMRSAENDLTSTLALCSVFDAFVFDSLLRGRVGGLHLTLNYLEETALPRVAPPIRVLLAGAVGRLAIPSVIFAPEWLRLRAFASHEGKHVPAWRQLWALTPHERLRLRAMLDAVVAELYGLDRDDLAWILRDCDHPTAQATNNAFARVLDPKGFWRIDKDQPPELRHTVLTLAAFADLKAAITARGGDCNQGIADFCAANDGEGWMLPETLRLADLGLGHDERAQHPQPVRARMGERFLPWQLEQSAEESWAECERHARNLLGKAGFEALKAQLEAPPPPILGESEAGQTRGPGGNGVKKNPLGDDFELVMEPPKDGGQTKLF